MSRHRKRRRDGGTLFLGADLADEARRHAPADVLAACLPGACHRRGRAVLVFGTDYRRACALAALLGLAVAVTCTSCTPAACAASGRPVAVVVLEDDALRARMNQYESQRN
jgi:hypothetical protein